MPGTLTLRPLTANLTRDTEFFGTMDPYCKVILGNQKLNGQVCRNGGKHPAWDDTIVLRRIEEPCFHVEVKEKDWLLPDSIIGTCDVNLREVEANKRVLKWFPLAFENKPVGKILLEINYEPDHQAFIQEALPQNANNVLNERTNQQPKPQEEQPSKIGFIQGIIHGWNPFGSKNQQQPVSESKQEVQAPVIQKAHNLQEKENPAPVQQAHNSYPASGHTISDYDRNNYLQQSQVYQENNWGPQHHAQMQEQNDYPQKYPQFSPQQSMNIDSNHQGAYYPNPNPVYVHQVAGDQNADNREVYDYRDNQHGQEYGSSGQYLNEYYTNSNAVQNSQDQNINKFDPLKVIRGL